MIGQSHLAVRLGELTRKLGLNAQVAPLAPMDAEMQTAWQGRHVFAGSAEDPELLHQLEPQNAQAVLLCSKSDELNLALALSLRDACAGVRLVISFFNSRMGMKIERELGNCAVLSSAELSAPSFAAAALHDGVLQTVRHGNEHFAFLQSQEGDEGPNGIDLGSGVRFLPLSRLAGPRPRIRDVPVRASRYLHQARHAADRYLVGILGGIAGLLALSTTYFRFDQGMSWLSSLYFVVTTFCTVGYGDYSLKDASDLTKFMGILLMLSSVTLTAGFFAILTNALVQKRTDVLEGRRRYRLNNHVLVCGLGLVGLRITECLRAMGLKVLVIEQDRSNPMLEEMRAHRVPFMVADATLDRTLRIANLPKVRSVVCAINNDLLDLEIGLAAREIRPDTHLVLRIFEEAFAQRIQRHFHIHTALSASSLSAPAFLAKALNPQALSLLELDGQPLLVSVKAASEGPKPGEIILVEGDSSLVLTPLTSQNQP